MNVTRSIAICMAEAGIRQKVVAERMGVSETQVSRIMTNNVCSIKTIEQLAEAFGIEDWEFIKKGGQ